jgi:Pentapeptide repeats (8 copies)
MKLLTILTTSFIAMIALAGSAQADPARNLQTLLTTNRCEGCDLSGVNLIGIDLSNAQLQGAKLNAANLTGADLSGANLSKVSAVGTSLVGANLQKAILVKASLIYANLANAQLNDAVLQGTDLQGANLAGADLNGAKVTESDFVGANLAEIKRSQPWLAADKNRFEGETKVVIDSKPTVIEKEVESPATGSPPVATPPSSGAPNTINQGSAGNNGVQGGRGATPDRIDGSVGSVGSSPIPSSKPPVTRGGRLERNRKPQKLRRRYSIPAWVGFTQTTTTGGDRYHDPDHPDVILELW